jgi:pyruvate-formate lyase
MYKNIIIGILLVAVILFFSMSNYEEKDCIKPEPYKQNQMVDGCVMQKTGDIWIKTCG